MGDTYHPKSDVGVPDVRVARVAAGRAGGAQGAAARPAAQDTGIPGTLAVRVVKTCAPLPDVAGQIVDGTLGLTRAGKQPHRRGDTEHGLTRVADAVLPRIAPGIDEATRTAGGGFPFLFRRQTPARPGAERLGLPEAHPNHRLVRRVPAPVVPILWLGDFSPQPRPALIRPSLPIVIAAGGDEGYELLVGHRIAADPEWLPDLDRSALLAIGVGPRRHLDISPQIDIALRIAEINDSRIAHPAEGEPQRAARLQLHLVFDRIER